MNDIVYQLNTVPPVWEWCLLCGVSVVCELWRRMIIYYQVSITKDQLNSAKQHATLCMESKSCCFVWEKSTKQKGCCFCTFLLCFCDNKGDPLIHDGCKCESVNGLKWFVVGLQLTRTFHLICRLFFFLINSFVFWFIKQHYIILEDKVTSTSPKPQNITFFKMKDQEKWWILTFENLETSHFFGIFAWKTA